VTCAVLADDPLPGLRLLGGEQGPQDQNPSPVRRDWSRVIGHRIILGRGGRAAPDESQSQEHVNRFLVAVELDAKDVSSLNNPRLVQVGEIPRTLSG